MSFRKGNLWLDDSFPLTSLSITTQLYGIPCNVSQPPASFILPAMLPTLTRCLGSSYRTLYLQPRPWKGRTWQGHNSWCYQLVTQKTAQPEALKARIVSSVTSCGRV